MYIDDMRRIRRIFKNFQRVAKCRICRVHLTEGEDTRLNLIARILRLGTAITFISRLTFTVHIAEWFKLVKVAINMV